MKTFLLGLACLCIVMAGSGCTLFYGISASTQSRQKLNPLRISEVALVANGTPVRIVTRDGRQWEGAAVGLEEIPDHDPDRNYYAFVVETAERRLSVPLADIASFYTVEVQKRGASPGGFLLALAIDVTLIALFASNVECIGVCWNKR